MSIRTILFALFLIVSALLSQTLAAGPIVSYSTYLGNNSVFNPEYVSDIAVDKEGSIYVLGVTAFDNVPATPGAFQSSISGQTDLYVTKINAEGTEIIYSTYIGGLRREYGFDIEVDDQGNAYVAGQTESTTFPTTPDALQPRPYDSEDTAFLLKLNPTGSALVYSTYIHTARYPYVAVDSEGNAYVTGVTRSRYFLTTPGAFQPKSPKGKSSTWDSAFVMKLNPTGSKLIYSTYLGNRAKKYRGISEEDRALGISVDRSGNTYIAGYSSSPRFPTTQGAYNEKSVDGAGFITKLNPTGSALVYSTYLPGADIRHIKIDSEGNAYVSGTGSIFLPTTPGAYQEKNVNGGWFVAKLNAQGSALDYSTLIPEIGINKFTVDPAGNAYLIGFTNSRSLPLTEGAVQTRLNNTDSSSSSVDLAFMKLNRAGSSLKYSTYFGGSRDELGAGIVLDSSGNVYLAGVTSSKDLPTTPGVFQPVSGFSESNAFVVKLSFPLPNINSIEADGKSLLVRGENFDDGAQILVNETAQATINDPAEPVTVLSSRKGAKKIPPGGTAIIRVRNGSGALSGEFRFIRPIE